MQSLVLSVLRTAVTDARVDYVGSITLDRGCCFYLGLREHQKVQVRNGRTGEDLWTYIILGESTDICCLNGAAAHKFSVGDPAEIIAYGRVKTSTPPPTARHLDRLGSNTPHVSTLEGPPATWCAAAEIDVACSKIHRPRLTELLISTAGANVRVDAAWGAGFCEGEQVHVVNVTTGARDVLPLEFAAKGSRECSLTGVSKGGYSVGDVIIVMSYESVEFPSPPKKMTITFPEEQPDTSKAPVKPDTAGAVLSSAWQLHTKLLWEGPALGQGLCDALELTKMVEGRLPRVLDCSCGAGFPGIELKELGVDVTLSDGSPDMVKAAKELAETVLGPEHSVDIRCCTWEELPATFEKESFDIILWRGNSMPYVCGAWTDPSGSNGQTGRDGYMALGRSAKAIFGMLVPGGRVYVDCAPTTPPGHVVELQREALVQVGPGEGGSRKVSVDWRFTIDEVACMRRWDSKMVVDNQHMNTTVTGLLVREREVRSILGYSGFAQVKSMPVQGEDVYQGFVAVKPIDSRDGYDDKQINRYKRVWNMNGKICWGLMDGVMPELVCTSNEAASTQKLAEARSGAMVLPNIHMHTFMASRLPGGIKAVLEVGCGTGRTTCDLASSLPDATIVACDPSRATINQARAYASQLGVDGRALFHCSTVESLELTSQPKTFPVIWSEAALSHAPPQDRQKAFQAISNLLEDGGTFLLNDVVEGLAPISPHTALHFHERLHYSGLWTAAEYMKQLAEAGLQVEECIDLTPHQAASYSALADEARVAATEAGDDIESLQVYNALALDYDASARSARNREVGWAFFKCTKVR
ncbi:unnamed protein product [Chrysoparadoxa australica]